jgi:hypothetical protein
MKLFFFLQNKIFKIIIKTYKPNSSLAFRQIIHPLKPFNFS